MDVKQFLNDSVFPFISASTEQQLWNLGVYKALFGKKGSIVQIKIKTPSGITKKFDVSRTIDTTGAVKIVKPWVAFRSEIINNIVYLKLNTFNDTAIIEEVDSFLKMNKEIKGVILDIRENGGGSSTIGLEVLKRFTKKNIPELHWTTKMNISLFKNYLEIDSNNISNFKYDGWYNWKLDTILKDTIQNDFKGNVYSGPLIVLISSSTVSAAEDFLIYLDQVRKYTKIGQITAGSTGESLYFDLKTGGIARIPSVHVTTPNDKEYVRKGIKPDIQVIPTLQEYLNNIDPVLNEAVKLLK